MVIGLESVESIDGGLGNDSIYANGAEQATGGADDDLLIGDTVPELATSEAAPLEEALMPFVEEFGVQEVRDAVEAASGLTTKSSANRREALLVSYTVLTNSPTNGPDNLFGGTGNDLIEGMAGDDRIFGNIGDDTLMGDGGNDLVSGGQGIDRIDGNAGNDMLRGDGTIDRIEDTGGGTDTISFAGGVTPGFTRNVPGPAGAPNGYLNFPGSSGERGVYIDLTNRIADNGIAADGGGLDDSGFLTGIENIIGSPFADYIVGTSGVNVIDGGGGTDVILGMDGNDTIYGNAGHDNIEGGNGSDTENGGPGTDFCQEVGATECNETGSASNAVIARDSTKVVVGAMTRPAVDHKDFYLVGGTGTEDVEVTYTSGSPDTVEFKLTTGTFDTSGAQQTDNCDYSQATGTPKRITCSSNDRIGTIFMAGLGGNDDLFGPYTGMPRATTFVATGNAGNDWIKGTNTSDDLLVDGAGNDILLGYGLDDGLLNNTGADEIWLGDGDDLGLTVSLCDGTGDQVTGGTGSDNASWAKLPSSFGGVGARLTTNTFGYKSSSGPTCTGYGGTVGTLSQIERLEGSDYDDGLIGDGNNNRLLGRPGDDTLSAGGGVDYINAWVPSENRPDDDVVDCGPQSDEGGIADPTPYDTISNCEGLVTRQP